MLSTQAGAVWDTTALIDPAVLVGTDSVHLVTPLAASILPPLRVSWQPDQQPQALAPTCRTANIATRLRMVLTRQWDAVPDACRAAK